MAIKVMCDKCGKELTDLGGLAFSPPEHPYQTGPVTWVGKVHLCRVCWRRFAKWLQRKS